jgi:ribosomal protein S18 acetylase RimI-like enzyme
LKDITICLKEFLNEEDCEIIEDLRNICTEKEDIFLKLELNFKLHIAQTHNYESSSNINEFFYYCEDILAGYLGILSMDGETGELTGMVHPLFRRKGISTKLLSLAIDECRRRGFKKILLVCDNSSSSGLEFIKSAGAAYSFSEYEMFLENNNIKYEVKDVVLRKATSADAEEISRQNSIYFGAPRNVNIIPETDEKRGRITYMVELGSRVIGKIRVNFQGDSGYISGFGILPEYRGKGYGKQSLRAALNLLQERDIMSASLEVAAGNKNALNLYKSCGFTEESVMDYYEVR